jgi:hypothetical protein
MSCENTFLSSSRFLFSYYYMISRKGHCTFHYSFPIHFYEVATTIIRCRDLSVKLKTTSYITSTVPSHLIHENMQRC